MARIKLVPIERLDPALREMAEQAVGHRQNPAIFQAMGNLPGAFKAYWDFYAPLRLEGVLDAKLKELVRLKIAALNNCAT